MSTINDILDVDVLTIIFEKIDTFRDWKSVCLTCGLWNEVTQLIKDKKASQFTKMDMTNRVHYIRQGNYRISHSISTMYWYLPNKRVQLHGPYSTIETKRKSSGEIISQTKTVKRFKFGKLIKETE